MAEVCLTQAESRADYERQFRGQPAQPAVAAVPVLELAMPVANPIVAPLPVRAPAAPATYELVPTRAAKTRPGSCGSRSTSGERPRDNTRPR